MPVFGCVSAVVGATPLRSPLFAIGLLAFEAHVFAALIKVEDLPFNEFQISVNPRWRSRRGTPEFLGP